jgi:hypothetical protein
MRMKARATLVIAIVAAAAAASNATEDQQDARLAKAKQLFNRYVLLEHAFDPAIADLYSDDAVIRNRRTYPTGQVRELTIPAPKYKELLRAAMPVAKQRGDTSTYSNVSYATEGDGVRVKADRFSELKKYHSPVSLLVKSATAGEWQIYEEISASQP